MFLWWQRILNSLSCFIGHSCFFWGLSLLLISLIFRTFEFLVFVLQFAHCGSQRLSTKWCTVGKGYISFFGCLVTLPTVSFTLKGLFNSMQSIRQLLGLISCTARVISQSPAQVPSVTLQPVSKSLIPFTLVLLGREEVGDLILFFCMWMPSLSKAVHWRLFPEECCQELDGCVFEGLFLGPLLCSTVCFCVLPPGLFFC